MLKSIDKEKKLLIRILFAEAIHEVSRSDYQPFTELATSVSNKLGENPEIHFGLKEIAHRISFPTVQSIKDLPVDTSNAPKLTQSAPSITTNRNSADNVILAGSNPILENPSVSNTGHKSDVTFDPIIH